MCMTRIISLPLCSIDVLPVSCEAIEEEEDVGTAGHSVADARPLLQQPLLPDQLSTADARVQILGLVVDQVGLGKQVCHT